MILNSDSKLNTHILRVLEGQMYQGGNNSNRKQVIQRYSTDEPQHEQQLHEQHVETSTETEPMDYNQGQTILTHAAKEHGGIETLVIDQSGRLPSIIQCAMKGDGTRVEVEQIPRLSELTNERTQAVEIASVQDPETGATRYDTELEKLQELIMMIFQAIYCNTDV